MIPISDLTISVELGVLFSCWVEVWNKSWCSCILGVGGSHVKSGELLLTRPYSCGFGPKINVQRRSNLLIKKNNRSSSISAEYRYAIFTLFCIWTSAKKFRVIVF